MKYYSEIKLTDYLKLLVGVENSTIIFSHSIKSERDKNMVLDLERKFFNNLIEDKNKLQWVESKLKDYLNGGSYEPSEEDVLFSRGTDFEIRVWKTLKSIKKGCMISYKELAKKSGFKNAERAVGNAMRKNYLLLFVPCHRVIKSNGEIGNFSAGKNIKIKLLNLEKKYEEKNEC